MELTDLELQIVNELKQFEVLNNKEIATKLNKDPGNISRKMKQLVEKQVVNKKRRSVGKITSNYYSLIDDDIENLQQVVVQDKQVVKRKSIPSEGIYDGDNTNVRESTLLRHKRDTLGTSEYYPRQVVQFKDTLRFLEIHDLLTEVLEYLSIESKSRTLTSKESRLVKILSQKSPNYTWILDCITLFLSTAKKIEQVIK
ncbi:MAG: DNA-binding protein containing HTH domain [Asgard archaea virus SkuldV2]|nr:MAG: DNA-binding protein containing HTH domain [Asgard archaea virus SkuldV2]